MRRLFSLLLATTQVVVLAGVLSAPALANEPSSAPFTVNGFGPMVRLQPGDSGDDVVALQQALSEAGFYHFEIDGEFGRTTSSAVVAFHKYLGVDRTDVFHGLDWIRLAMLPDPDLPARWNESDYIEVDITRQLLFLIKDNQVAQILPVSTGGGYTYISERTGKAALAATPLGDFRLKWHQTTWVCDEATGWCVYKYWAFTDYYGVHGYRQVPTYPASHGCVRIETWDADWIEPLLAVGMPIHIWRTPPVVEPPPRHPPLTVPSF